MEKYEQIKALLESGDNIRIVQECDPAPPQVGYIVRGDEVFEWCVTAEAREEVFLCRLDNLQAGETVTGRWLTARKT